MIFFYLTNLFIIKKVVKVNKLDFKKNILFEINYIYFTIFLYHMINFSIYFKSKNF